MVNENEVTQVPIVTEPIVEIPVVEPVSTPVIEPVIIPEVPTFPELDEIPPSESIIEKIGNFFNSWIILIPSMVFLMICIYYLFIK